MRIIQNLLPRIYLDIKEALFTGADNDNPGLIKVADGGMLFLDEVHCLKPECQENYSIYG